MDEKEAEAHPVMGTIFLVYGSIEISHDIYVVGISVVCQINCVG